MRFRTLVSFAAALLLLAGVPMSAQYAPSAPADNSAIAGRFVAANYNYPSSNNYVTNGNSATGAGSITLQVSSIKLPDGRTIYPYNIYSPIIVGNGSTAEQVTPTSVSNCFTLSTPGQGTCTINASFTFTHGFGEPVVSGSAGAAEAAYDAYLVGGGLVQIDRFWARGIQTACTGCSASSDAALAALVPLPGVAFESVGNGNPLYWNIQQTASTFLATPTTLTAVTALPSATPVGAYGTGTYHLCIAYVDIAGQEGACSADFSEAGLATGSFIFTPPAASTGAVGYTIYISLTSGTYSLSYQVPLTSSICTLTRVETVTPACAVTNTTYGQTGATATVTAITVSTSPVGMQLGGVSGTLLTGNPNGRTTYGYVPSSHLAANGIVTLSLPFTAGGIGSATPIAMGTVNLPAGIMNFVGKGIRVCGEFINTDVNSTVQNVNIYWDAAGSDTAGSPVKIGSLQAAAGPGTAATYKGNFCETFHTSVSGASVTAGTIFPDFSLFNYYLASAPAINMLGGETGTAGIGSLNLAGGAGFGTRLSVVHTNTTGNATPTLQNLTIEVL